LAILAFGILWVYEDAKYLRYYIMFLGAMVSTFSLYDVIDDLINRSLSDSDASQFALIAGQNGKFWGTVWLLMGVAMNVFAVYLALHKHKSPGKPTKGFF
jgi:hypothetical protein